MGLWVYLCNSIKKLILVEIMPIVMTMIVERTTVMLSVIMVLEIEMTMVVILVNDNNNSTDDHNIASA